MPRKSKQQSTTVTAPGQPYGIAGEQQAAMNIVPLPDTQIDPQMQNIPTPSTSSPLGASPDSNLEEDVNPLANIIDAARNSPAPAGAAFSAPTERPEESVLARPPLPPAVPNNAANIIRMIAQANGDSSLNEIATNVERLRY